MKNIYKIVIALVSVLFLSCNADAVDNRPVLENLSVPVLPASLMAKTYVLAEENATEVVDNFVWSTAEYSQDVVVTYTLMMDKTGGDFSAAKVLATTSDVTEASVLVKTLNQAAIDLGAEPGKATEFDIKVKCSVSGGVGVVSENKATITVTAYSGLVPYAFTDWYLVGDATAAGWDTNNGNQPLFRSGTNAKLYKFTGYFKAGAFKLISNPGSWVPMYGMGAGGNLAYRGGDSDPDPATFNIATAGYYTFTMNLETLKYTLETYNASAASTYSRVGFIGSSRTGNDTGWAGDDTPMTQSAFNSHFWTITINLFEGKGKFRANNAWDVNWGGDTAFSAYPTQGTSGGDIPVAKSKYKVYFNDLDGSYLMIPNQQ